MCDKAYCFNCKYYRDISSYITGWISYFECGIKLNELKKLTKLDSDDFRDFLISSPYIKDCLSKEYKNYFNRYNKDIVQRLNIYLSDTPYKKNTSEPIFIFNVNEMNKNNDCSYFKSSIIYKVKRFFKFRKRDNK